MMSPSGLVNRLAKFTSCDIGDALVKLHYPYGGFLDGLRMRSPGRIIGPAVTVKMVEASNTTSPKPEKHFVDYNQAGKIMYIQQPKGLYSACWGGLMSTQAKYLGAGGVVVDGRIRDVAEHREKDFPVFSRDTSILGSNTFTRASAFNVPLQFKGDLWVSPGDILVGDEDGVVVVPPSLVERVMNLCQERYEIDKKTIAALDEGTPMGEAIARFRK